MTSATITEVAVALEYITRLTVNEDTKHDYLEFYRCCTARGFPVPRLCAKLK